MKFTIALSVEVNNLALLLLLMLKNLVMCYAYYVPIKYYILSCVYCNPYCLSSVHSLTYCTCFIIAFVYLVNSFAYHRAVSNTTLPLSSTNSKHLQLLVHVDMVCLVQSLFRDLAWFTFHSVKYRHNQQKSCVHCLILGMDWHLDIVFDLINA